VYVLHRGTDNHAAVSAVLSTMRFINYAYLLGLFAGLSGRAVLDVGLRPSTC